MRRQESDDEGNDAPQNSRLTCRMVGIDILIDI
jgi:hypothetical protein